MESQNIGEPTLEEIEALMPPAKEPTLEEIEALMPPAKEEVPAASEPTLEEIEALMPPAKEPTLEEIQALSPGPADLKTKVLMADEERKKTLKQIEQNEKIEAQAEKMRQSGTDEGTIEAYKKSSGYQEGSWLKGLGESIGRMSQAESSFPIDVERAKQPEQGFVSPLKVIETAAGDLTQAWKERKLPSPSTWFQLDRGVRERVKENLKRPLIDEAGVIDFEAVQTSNLSRKDQNDLVLDYAAGKTGIPKKVWAEILSKRFGVDPNDGAFNTTAKRAAQVVDSFAFNIPSRQLARLGSDSPVDRVKALKKGQPLIPITVTRTEEGKFYTQDGVEIEDADADDTEAELKQKGWAATVDNMIGTVEAQAMENWAQLGDVAMAATGVGLTKGVGSALTKVGLKGAGKAIAKGATGVSKITSQVGENALRLARQGKRIGAAEAKGSLALKVARAVDRTVSPIGTTAVLSGLGAPEGQEIPTAMGAAVMTGAMKAGAVPLHRLIEADNPFSNLAKDGKALKAIMRTEKYESLPKYVKRYYDRFSNGMDYDEFRDKAPQFLKIHEELGANMQRWVKGDVDDKVISAYFDQLANDEKLRGVFDSLSILSDPTEGLTPVGRFRKKTILNQLVDAATYNLEQRKSEAQAGATPELQDHVRMLSIMRDKFKNAVHEVPTEILNGPQDKFMEYVRGLSGEGGQKLKYMAEEIKSILEGTQGADPYKTFAADLMKLYAITADSDTPMAFRDMLQYIANAPELAKNLDSMGRRAAVKTRDPFTGKAIERIHPEATQRMLQESPEGIQEALRLSQETVGAKFQLEQDLREAKSIPEQMRAARRDYEERLAELRTQTSLSRGQLEGEVDRALEKSNRHTARALALSTEVRNMATRVKKDDIATVRRVNFLSDKIRSMKMLSVQEINSLPKEIQGLARKANYEIKSSDAAIRRSQLASSALGTLEQRLSDMQALKSLMMEKDFAMSLKRGEAGVMKALMESLPVTMRNNGLQTSKYFQNVMALIAKDIASGAKDGTFAVNPLHIGMLRMLENANNHERLLGFRLEPSVQRALKAEILKVTDALHDMSQHTEAWRAEIKKLNELSAKNKDDVSSIARQISFMRDGFRVAKLSREIQQRSAALYAISEKLADGSKHLSVKETRLLTWFAKSTMVERLRMAKDPSWVVTYRGEVDAIFKALKDNLPAINDRAVELVSKATGVDPSTIDGTIITSWFIVPGTNYDGPGRLRFSLAMADYWHNAGTGLWETGGVGESVRKWMSAEVLSTVLSRDTALSIERDTQLVGAMKRKAVSAAKRFFAGYVKEMEGLTVKGKSFQYFQNRPAFVSLFKRLQGGMQKFTKNHYLVVDGQLTDNGQIVLAWAKSGFTDTALNKLVEEKFDERVKNAKPGELDILQEQMKTLKSDIKTYLPTPTSTWEGAIRDVTAEDYEMVVRALKVHQKWDRLKLEARNSMNVEENKRAGTDFPQIAYFPYRIDAGTQLLVELALDPQNIDHPTMHTQLFGRMITSSIEGQVAKAQGVTSEASMRHPMENFYLDSVSLFQAVLTRDPVRRLHESTKFLRLGGHEHAARAILSHFMGADIESKANRAGGINRMFDWVYNRSPIATGLHILGIPFEPAIRLATPLKTIVENPIQSGLMGSVSSPLLAGREVAATLWFYPQFAVDLVKRFAGYAKIGKAPDPNDLKTFHRLFSPLSPEYTREMSIVSEAINAEKNVKAEKGLNRIEWEGSAAFKKLDVLVGDTVSQIFAAEQALFKENSERAVLDIRLGTAASIWRSTVEDLYSLKREGRGREELVRHAQDTLAGEFRGTLDNTALVYRFAAEMADGVLEDAPLRGLRGFAVTYANSRVGRFDPDNLPQAIKAIARWKPGAALFYNPMSAGIYRLGTAMHALMGKRGAASSDVLAAAASVACILGATSAAGYAAYAYGVPWFSKLSPMAGAESLYNLVTEPEAGMTWAGTLFRTLVSEGTGSRGGGDMMIRAVLTVMGELGAYVTAAITAAEDGTQNTQAHEQEQRDRLFRATEAVYDAGPVAILTASFVSAPRWGWGWYNQDASEFFDAIGKMSEGQGIHPEVPEVLAPEERNAVAGMLRLLERGARSILPLRPVENMDEKYIAAAYSGLGINLPGEVLVKMAKTLSERRRKEELRAPSTLEGFPSDKKK